MTSKIKQSIAVQRQFPDHIKENYPVFVEFVKLYYDFLQETQSQNLESIKDVDTTLDEFIDKFKNELAKNFPVELSNDKRLLLKHLREFYLSRGSEASYKFLFRTLFGKDSVDIFYPSTQMLRVSDGKWQQDVSIFVTPNEAKPDVNSIVGKTILITNSKGKVIRTFVNRIQPYSDTICEVFIQRDYINEIAIGDIASCEDTGLTATILACPTKVSIYKAGKGFKAGELFSLKTQLGRGCVIKITKVGTEGEIKAIQVVRFGLDYKTKFYSYLSSKDLEAIEYHHPLTKDWGGPGLPTPYNENSGGFIDYGWGSKQTYFYYDADIPVATPDHASDRFFANPDYVGEVVQQFYTDDSVNPIDEDLAIIEIDLGAVAKYPGYYMKADGFISDEMYIQDGKYYQAFSYVIKVEEELRKYADIIKALVHPAGMKLYGEYNIFNNIEVSATMPKLFSILQLPLTDHPPSTGIVDDRGYGYTSYTTSLVDGQIVTTPANGANKVYASQGKASLLIEKITNEIVENITDQISSKAVNKEISENIQVQNTDSVSKQAFKDLQDAISNIQENRYFLNQKFISDDYTLSEIIGKVVSRGLTDSLSLLESRYNEPIKNVNDTVNSPTDIFLKEFSKNISDALSTQENLSSLYEKYLADNYSANDSQSKALDRQSVEEIQSPSDNYSGVLDKTTNEQVENLDDNIKNSFKNNSDQINTQELISKAYERPLAEIISLISDAISNAYSKPLEDTISLDDSIMNSVERFRYFNDTISDIQDVAEILKVFLLEDIFNIVFIETKAFGISKIISDDTAIQELVTNAVTKYLEDIIPELVDSISSSFDKSISDLLNAISDSISNNLEKILSDSIDFIQDSESNKLEKILSDALDSFSMDLNFGITKLIEDNQQIVDQLSNLLQRIFTDILSIEDSVSNDCEKILSSNFDTRSAREALQLIMINDTDHIQSVINQDFIFNFLSEKSVIPTKSFGDTINNSTNGRIRLSPYDLENYFETFSDYQPATNIT